MNRIVAAAFIFIVMLSGCAQPKDLEYRGFRNIRINTVGFSKTQLGADIQLYNPNGYPLVFKSALADVFLDNQKIGNVTLDTTLTIPRKDTFLVPVVLDANLGGALGNLVQALGRKEVTIRFTGTVKAGRNGVFVNIPINYEAKQKISLDF
ncbi:MAG: LEA type 2 family protein [Flavipsychrobacter sp.]|nr:LEA type 2 family protein [Flavipsychrobacter sp.]